jgi:uncharacterized protein (DUF983 family)
MDAKSHNICPRCHQGNLTQARYCAECGLNLETAGATASGPGVLVGRETRSRPRPGTLVVILLIVLAAALAVFASLTSNLRARRHAQPPIPASLHAVRIGDETRIVETRTQRTVSRFEIVD